MSFLTRVFSKSKKKPPLQPLETSLTHITHTPSETSSRRRRTLRKRSSQVPTEVQSTIHQDDSDPELEIISRAPSLESLKMINHPSERPPPPMLYHPTESGRSAHRPHSRSESDLTSSLGRSIPESQRLINGSKPTVTEVIYGSGSPYPSEVVRTDSDSPGPTPIIPGPGFVRRNVSSVSRGRSQPAPESELSYFSSGSSRRSHRSRRSSATHRSRNSGRESSGMRTREIIVPTDGGGLDRGVSTSMERGISRMSESPLLQEDRETRSPSFHSRRSRRQSSLLVTLPNGEKFEAYADPRFGRGKFTYYVIPFGMKITFKDQSGREITTVGDSSRRHVAPLEVHDEEGKVLYEVRGRRRRRSSNFRYRDPSPRWRGPHIVVIDGDGQLLPVYKRRIV